ncbi:hypothetical protein SMICM304S_07554 [Streptomyces microflavus]
MKEPRKEGMAQKGAAAVAAGGELHRGDGAGAEPPAQRRARSGDRCDALGKVLGHRGGRLLGVPGQRHGGVLPLGGADGEQLAAVARGVRGVDAAVEDGLEPVGDVGVVVESEDTVRLRQGLGEVLAVALGHAADGDDGLGAAVLLEIVGFSRASTESFLAASTNPQVLTTATSASEASSTRSQPSAAKRPASSSESTSLRAQPRVTRATVRRSGMDSRLLCCRRVVPPCRVACPPPATRSNRCPATRSNRRRARRERRRAPGTRPDARRWGGEARDQPASGSPLVYVSRST